MSKHLNLFNPYTKYNDKDNQLENDLTRAFAICIQEDKLLLHEVLKAILGADSSYYNSLFDNYEDKNSIKIEIQKKVNNIESFKHLFAVSLSEHEMDPKEFYKQNNNRRKNCICDLVISIDDIVIIIEVKPDNHDCTSQLYNQAFNICRNISDEGDTLNQDKVTAIDLNWKALMRLCVRTLNFEKAIKEKSRYLNDFIQYIQSHNHKWLPEPSLSSLTINNYHKIKSRFKSILNQLESEYAKSRLSFEINAPWANEAIINIPKGIDNIKVNIYPGNTKGQGKELFKEGKTPKFKTTIHLLGKEYKVKFGYHIKFTSFQKYFTGLYFKEDDFDKELYSSVNFNNYTGRKKKAEGDWEEIEKLFDNHFNTDFNWREKCKWQEKILNTNKTQFDISFGYDLWIHIPFQDLQEIDKDNDNIENLIQFILELKNEFSNLLITE
ncbi:MAG: hypothetical protein ACEPOV_06025 [Hyphomicrobiales bacterium]